jgi:hypothetical protein
MSQLMGQQAFSRVAVWDIASLTKNDMTAEGESLCPNCLSSGSGAIIGMNAHLSKIHAESRLEIRARLRVDRLSAAFDVLQILRDER